MRRWALWCRKTLGPRSHEGVRYAGPRNLDQTRAYVGGPARRTFTLHPAGRTPSRHPQGDPALPGRVPAPETGRRQQGHRGHASSSPRPPCRLVAVDPCENTTASTPCTASDSDSRWVMSPTTAWTSAERPRARPGAAHRGARTWYPTRTLSSTTWRPMLPVPPITRTVRGRSVLGSSVARSAGGASRRARPVPVLGGGGLRRRCSRDGL